MAEDNGLMGSAGSAIAGSAVSTGLGMMGQAIGAGNQMGNNRKLIRQNVQASKELSEFNRKQNLMMWKDTNYAAQRDELEKAGLNPALLYGKGGGGGASTDAGGTQVSGAVAQDNSGAMMQSATQGLMTAANIELAKSQARKNNVEADKLAGVDTQDKQADINTKNASRDLLVENLRQAGIGNMQDNAIKAWLWSDDDAKEGEHYNDKYDYHVGVGETSQGAKQVSAALLKTASETNKNLADIDLTNEKIKGYWTELLNETKKANAAGIQAAAQKLSSEWGTGEFTNWKTWAEQANQAIRSLGNLKTIKVDKSGSTYNTKVDNY